MVMRQAGKHQAARSERCSIVPTARPLCDDSASRCWSWCRQDRWSPPRPKHEEMLLYPDSKLGGHRGQRTHVPVEGSPNRSRRRFCVARLCGQPEVPMRVGAQDEHNDGRERTIAFPKRLFDRKGPCAAIGSTGWRWDCESPQQGGL